MSTLEELGNGRGDAGGHLSTKSGLHQRVGMVCALPVRHIPTGEGFAGNRFAQ